MVSLTNPIISTAEQGPPFTTLLSIMSCTHTQKNNQELENFNPSSLGAVPWADYLHSILPGTMLTRSIRWVFFPDLSGGGTRPQKIVPILMKRIASCNQN